MAVPAQRPGGRIPTVQEKQGMPAWAMVGGLALGTLVIAALGAWLAFGGGWLRVMSWLPPGVRTSLGGAGAEGKVIQTKADPEGAAYEGKAYQANDRRGHGGQASKGDDHADDAGDDTANAKPGASLADKKRAAHDAQHDQDMDVDAVKAEAVLAPIKANAAAADDAIAALSDKPQDQARVVAAEKAIDTLRTTPIPPATPALKQAALEQRTELVNGKKAALAQAQQMARATHLVQAGKAGTISLRSAANDKSDEVASMEDGTRVHEFLDDHGWARVEVISGGATGKNGYVHVKYLQSIKK